jgi:hypothetical protein
MHENDKHNNKYKRLFFPKLKQIKTLWERRKGKEERERGWVSGWSVRRRGSGAHWEKRSVDSTVSIQQFL